MKTVLLGLALGGFAVSSVLACASGGDAMSNASKDDDSSADTDDDADGNDTESDGAPSDTTEATDTSTDGSDTPSEALLHKYDAADPKIRVSARAESTPDGPRFSAAGGYMTVHFEGEAIAVSFVDQSNGKSSYDAWIDGAAVAKVIPVAESRKHQVATGLAPGEHTLVFSKRTEASIGKVTLLSVEIEGTLLEAPAPAHRIEFIGDSITAGAGVEAADGSPECDDWGVANNATATYAAVAARALQAEYYLTAVSGIGMVRNYSAMYDARPMPEVYDLLNIESMNSPEWDRSKFVPDALVIALGTNDFSPGDNAADDPRPQLEVEPYTEAYIAFIDKLRGYYPDADIFGVSSPMLGDGWPDSSYTSKTNLLDTLDNVQAHYEELGDTKVHTYVMASIGGSGCGTHPDVAQHQMLGEALAEEIRSVTGW